MSLRYYSYLIKSHSFYAGITTLSIGNLQMGGGGKTPFAIKLLSTLISRNLNFIHASRAYKSKVEKKGLILDLNKDKLSDLNPTLVGDEPYMIMQNLKQGVFLLGKMRIDLIKKFSGRIYKTSKYEALVLEDAFQHLKISRDLDIILIDVTCPVEKFKLFPIGNLRESAIQLWRADFIILSKVNQITSQELHNWREFVSKNKRFDALTSELEYSSQSIVSLDGEKELLQKNYENKPAVLCSAIANPKSFEKLVRNLNIKILQSHHLPDHSSFSKTKIASILDYATQKDAIIICTEKDAVKLKQYSNSDRIYYVKLKLKLSTAGEAPWKWLTDFIQK